MELPKLESLIHPKGEDGAIEGFGVPLADGATKDDLHEPIHRGAYALASKDRKTVLKCLVMHSHDAGFDPKALLDTPLVSALDPILSARIGETQMLLQLCFESHDPMVAPSLQFLFDVAGRMGYLTHGVIADPLSESYMHPNDVLHKASPDRVNASLTVSVQIERFDSQCSVQTIGLQKFSLPDLRLPDVGHEQGQIGVRFLTTCAQTILDGHLVEPGDRLGAKSLQFQVAASQALTVLELIPPVGRTASDVLEAWNDEHPIG